MIGWKEPAPFHASSASICDAEQKKENEYCSLAPIPGGLSPPSYLRPPRTTHESAGYE